MGRAGSWFRGDPLSSPSFELQSDDGRRISQEDAAGRPILLCLAASQPEPLLEAVNTSCRSLLAGGCLVYGIVQRDVDGIALLRDHGNILFTLLSDPEASLWATLNIPHDTPAIVLLNAAGLEKRRWSPALSTDADMWREAALEEPHQEHSRPAWRRSPAVPRD